jgi:hypothetical protein
MTALAERDAKTLAGGGALGAAHRQTAIAANLPRYALIGGPDAEFIKGLECAIEPVGRVHAEPGTARGYEAAQEMCAHLDTLFAKRAVPYRFDDITISWAGDRGQHQLVVEPALQVLADSRLGGARNEFEAALGHLRVGTQKELEDAIEEAAKSVESALKVLAAETSTITAGNATVARLFDALKAAGHLPDYSDNLVQAAARIRNKAGGHGAGGQPRQIAQDIAIAAVNAAATAIVLIGGRLD